MQLDVAVLVLLGLGVLAVGLAIGVAFGRSRGGNARRKVLELEMELKLARESQASYQDKVASHFEETSEMVHALTQQYRNVYEHLAEGARELCPDRMPPLGRGSMEEALLADVAGAGDLDDAADLELPPSRLPDPPAIPAEPEGMEAVLQSETPDDSPEVEFGSSLDDDARADDDAVGSLEPETPYDPEGALDLDAPYDDDVEAAFDELEAGDELEAADALSGDAPPDDEADAPRSGSQ